MEHSQEHSDLRAFRPALWALAGAGALALFLKSGVLAIITILLGLTVLVTYLWSRYWADRLEYRRSFSRDRCFVGEELELTVEVTNRKILPVTYLTVEDGVPDELQVAARRLKFVRPGRGVLQLIFGLAWYQKVVRHYRVTPVRRGYYRLGPIRLTGGDPFGYVKQHRTVEEQEHLIVYPRILPLEQLGIPTRRPFGDVKSNDRLFEDPMRFAGVREYQPGDPMNRVHWKASAAAGRLQVRLLDPSANLGVAVFLNTWGYDLFWQGSDTAALESGCVIAASVADWAVQEGLPVGVYANALTMGWGMNLRLPPARGAHVLPQVLEGLARLQMPSRHSLAEILTDEAPQLSYGTSVVVITRLVSDDLAAMLLRVHRSGRPVTLVVAGGEGQELGRLPGIRIYSVPGEEALHAAILA